jgi:hypothetical protein
MINPTEEDIGRLVVYIPYEGATAEEGVITSMNKSFVFVRYKSSNTSQATGRSRLCWANPEIDEKVEATYDEVEEC